MMLSVAITRGMTREDRSLDQLVREHQEQDRDRHAEGLGGFEIDDELGFCWLLHRQFSRLRPAQNAINIPSSSPALRGKAWPIRHQTLPFTVITHAPPLTHTPRDPQL